MASRVRLYLVDDNADHRLLLKRFLKKAAPYEFQFDEFENGAQALSALGNASRDPDLILLDYRIPGQDGLQVLREIRRRSQHVPVMMVTSYGSIESAVQAMKEGAFDYLTKPFRNPQEVALSIERALQHRALVAENTYLRSQVRDRALPPLIVGRTAAMQQIEQVIERIAPTDATVLLTGESGTGKDVLARTIHARSRRNGQKFLAINCSALPEHLLESELFGHVKGAFTGAVSNKPGLLKEANHGSFFFDEIGELPMAMQTKLLRFLQDQEVRQTGSVRSETIDVRIFAATNHDLQAAVKAGRFREDLFYRLNVIHIRVPPLRERKADIPIFISQFINSHHQREGRKILSIDAKASAFLESLDWPGNIRELKNVIERALIFTDGDRLTLKSLAFLNPEAHAAAQSLDDDLSFAKARKGVLDAFTARYLESLLRKHHGNVTLAAQAAGLGRQSFHRLMKLHHVRSRSFR